MKDVLYQGTVVPANKASDGETPTMYYVTQEVNGVAIWKESAEGGLVCLKCEAYVRPNDMIERVVRLVFQEREERAKK
jgi:hypothetical protein